ncbi:NAD(P)H-binding protein [Streptomonospora sediminis]
MAENRPILVTGATGNVGKHVVRRLLEEEGRAVRALTRDPARADLPEGAEAVAGDLAHPGSLGPALEGIDAAFLVWPSLEADKAAPEAIPAIAARARNIVYLSAMGLPEHDGPDAPSEGILGSHMLLERLIRKSAADWTFVRAGGFAANLAGWIPQIRATGTVRAAFAELARPLIHEADIAEVAVRALTEPGHSGASYEITGPEPVTQAEQARIIGEELGVPARFEELSAEEAVQAFITDGLPAQLAQDIVQGQAAMAEQPESTTDTFEKVAGVPPRSFRQWAADRAGGAVARA